MLRKGRDKEWSTRSRKYRQSEVLEWKKTKNIFVRFHFFFSNVEAGLGWNWGSWKDNTGERRTITQHAALDQKQNLHAGEIRTRQLGLNHTNTNMTKQHNKVRFNMEDWMTIQNKNGWIWSGKKNKKKQLWSTGRRNCRFNIFVQQTMNHNNAKGW